MGVLFVVGAVPRVLGPFLFVEPQRSSRQGLLWKPRGVLLVGVGCWLIG